MGKVIRLTESDLTRIVKRVIKENENEEYLEKIKTLIDNEYFETALEMGKALGLKEKVEELILIKKIYMLIVDKKFETMLLVKVVDATENDRNVRISDIIHSYIDKEREFLRLLSQLDPSLRKEIYDDVFTKVSDKFLKEHGYLFGNPLLPSYINW